MSKYHKLSEEESKELLSNPSFTRDDLEENEILRSAFSKFVKNLYIQFEGKSFLETCNIIDKTIKNNG